MEKYVIPVEEIHLSTRSEEGKIEAIEIRDKYGKVLVSIKREHNNCINVEVEDGELVIDVT